MGFWVRDFAVGASGVGKLETGAPPKKHTPLAGSRSCLAMRGNVGALMGVTVRICWGYIGWDDGKENGNYYLLLRSLSGILYYDCTRSLNHDIGIYSGPTLYHLGCPRKTWQGPGHIAKKDDKRSYFSLTMNGIRKRCVLQSSAEVPAIILILNSKP